MPLVEITLRKGRTPQQLQTIGDAIHVALVSTANVPADDRFQIFHEVEPHALVADPNYGGVHRSGDLVVIKITLNAGRTLEVKKRLYAEIVARIGIRPDDVLISLVEVTKENWSFGKGIATYG